MLRFCERIVTTINLNEVNTAISGMFLNNAEEMRWYVPVTPWRGKDSILFINQEMQTSNLLNRITELKALQIKGIFKAPQIKMDTKDFGIGAQILHDIDISKIRLVSNAEQTKRVGMIGYGLEIMEYVTY